MKLMKLIKTNDGLFGWNLNGKMIWCDTRAELNTIGWHHVATRNDPEWYTSFVREVDCALDTMRMRNHSMADFGVFGSFIYSSEEDAA